ncbi:MAG TPA: L,D-transpeptidase family protein [Burkholderiales bacterium]|nr:L,D-transpeptidase family protein [Burkholderiales bacterium]
MTIRGVHSTFATTLVPRIAAAALLVLVVCPATATTPEPAVPAASAADETADALLARTLQEIRNDDLDAALTEIDKVLHDYPNFRLANLIKGDLLLARAQPLRAFGAAPNAPRDRVEDLREEALARLARYQLERPTDRVPKSLLQLNRDQRYALVVDTAQSTLYVFENHDGQPRYLADYYVSSGKNGADKMRSGDKRTPLGVYQVAASLPRARLTAFYGVAAYPLNYPNEWDRREGRDGRGIWLHGVPINTYSRPPRASDGCVVLTNQDLEAIGKNLRVGVTPVIITENMEWEEPEAAGALREQLLQSLEGWRRDWESRDTGKYLKHYAPGFSAGHQNLAAWSQQKRAVNSGKTWIKVGLDRVSIFLYPDRDDLAVITFDQDYSSNNLSNKMKKRQYWIREKGAWHIIYEGAA